MSNENIYGLLKGEYPDEEGPYTGKYEKHMKDLPKPTYSTFYEKNREYDGTFPRYFKQRDAIIGPIVNESVDPENFLRAGEGVKHGVPAVHKKKVFTKPPLDHGVCNLRGAGLKKGLPPSDAGLSAYQGNETQFAPNGRRTGDEIKEGMLDGIDNEGDGGQGNYFGKNGRVKKEYGEGASGISGVVENGPLGISGKDENVALQHGNTNDGLYGPFVLEGKKNFVTSNIVQVGNMVPKRRKDQPVNLASREAFGRLPSYLGRVKKEIEEEKMRFKNIDDARVQQKSRMWEKHVYRLDERERLDLIEKLTTKLKQKNGEMNRMPFVKDTFAQVKRRSDLEKSIKEIEVALGKIDKDAVFVYNDDPRCVYWTKDAAIQEAARFASLPSQ